MRNRLLLVTAASAFLALSCWDFDAAYTSYCFDGRCAADAGVDGGAGGGTAGTGGGVGGGGGAAGVGGGASDAGCPDFVCPELEYTANRLSSYYIVVGGAQAESLKTFRVWGAIKTGTAYAHYLYEFADGGFVGEVDRTPDFDSRVEGHGMRGVSYDDTWYAYRTYVTHIERSARTADFPYCTPADGGAQAEPWFYNVLPVSADEAYFIGAPFAFCKWSRASGAVVELVDPTPRPNMYLLDAYQTPSGELFAVGGDFVANEGTGAIFRFDGTEVMAPKVVDTFYGDGYASIGGHGADVWALARTGLIVKLDTNRTQFVEAFNAGFLLAQLAVNKRGQVFAIGQNPSLVAYFDGTSWSNKRLPNLDLRPQVRWEAIEAVEDGLILAGYEMSTSGNTPVVYTYRLFGK